MAVNYRSTKLTTRNGVDSRLHTLSTRNEELETKLREAEKTCQQNEAKILAQDVLIQELMATIHSLASNHKETNSSGDENTEIPEKMCLLLTKNAQRISDLVEEVESKKLQLRQIGFSNGLRKDHGDGSNDTEQDLDDVGFVDISLSDNENHFMAVSSSISSFETPASGKEIIRLEEEIVRISSKCNSLERSLKTLKQKSSQRELRSMKSLRNMRQQVENLEQERRRRLDLQSQAEERALQLEIELSELREQNNRQNVFRRPQQSSELESLENGTIGDGVTTNVVISREKGVDHCRELTMLRNQLGRDSFPPLLLSVSEESEDSSEESENDFSLYVDL